MDDGGMLADFGMLKQALRDVIAGLDHTNLNDIPAFNNDPSAERIALFVFKNLEDLLSRRGVDPAALRAVDVFETPVNMARYERS